MPVLIDHEKTRQQIADIAGNIVAREGVAALTSRRMAEEAGTSRGIVTTYFRDMQDLVVATFLHATGRQGERFEAAIAEGPSLQRAIEALLPLDDERLHDAKITFAFLGVALSDPKLYEIMAAHNDGAADRFESILIASGRRKSAKTRSDAQHIVSVVIGVAIHYCFHSKEVPTERARNMMIDSALKGISVS